MFVRIVGERGAMSAMNLIVRLTRASSSWVLTSQPNFFVVFTAARTRMLPNCLNR